GPSRTRIRPTGCPRRTCRYVSEWVAVKIRWQLSIDPAEHEALVDVAADCQRMVVEPVKVAGTKPAPMSIPPLRASRPVQPATRVSRAKARRRTRAMRSTCSPNHRTWTVPRSTNAVSRCAPVTRTGSAPTATASAAKTDPTAREPMRPDQQAQDTRHHQRAIGGKDPKYNS